MKDRTLRIVAVLALLLGASAVSFAARADHVQGQSPFFAGVPVQSFVNGHAGSSINVLEVVWGTSLEVHPLSFGGAGSLTVSLRDIEWPEALQSMQLLVTDLDGIWQELNGPGSLFIDLNGPANLFVAVFARSQGKDMPGLYHLRADFAPVPLPAAVWLLISGLGGLSLLRRKASAK